MSFRVDSKVILAPYSEWETLLKDVSDDGAEEEACDLHEIGLNTDNCHMTVLTVVTVDDDDDTCLVINPKFGKGRIWLRKAILAQIDSEDRTEMILQIQKLQDQIAVWQQHVTRLQAQVDWMDKNKTAVFNKQAYVIDTILTAIQNERPRETITELINRYLGEEL